MKVVDKGDFQNTEKLFGISPLLILKSFLLALHTVLGSLFLIDAVEGQSKPSVPDKEQTLQFPEDRSLGILYVAPVDASTKEDFWWLGSDFKKIGFARGKVSLPADSLVRLDVSTDACNDLSRLSKIPPNSIHALYFNIGSDPQGQYEHIGAQTGLRFLRFRSCPVTDEGILKLAGLTNLEDFTCSVNGFEKRGFGITNKGLNVIAKFNKLRRLDLRSNPITDEGLGVLEACDALEILSLDGTQVTGTGLNNLLMLPNLRIISFGAYKNGAPVDDEGMKVLGQLRQITSLSLNGTKVTDAGMKHISGLENLEDLSLDFTEVTEFGLKYLAGMSKLKSLRFQKSGSDNNLTDIAAEKLAEVPNLERVIGRWKLTEIGFKHLAKLKKLKSLDFENDVSDENLSYIAALISLEDLGFNRCPITDQGLGKLAALKNLERLSIWGSQVTGAGLQAIERIPKLRHLTIEIEDFGPTDDWKTLGEMSGLATLSITVEDFGRPACSSLAKLKNLEVLEIKNNTNALGTEFFDAVSGLTKLTSLNFGNFEADSDFRKLSGLKKLEYLEIFGDITDQQLLLLAELPSLRIFQSSSKALTLEGIEEFKKRSNSLQSFLHPLVRNQ